MSTWHTCETTHCKAGWIITLAGEMGKILEEKIGTASAAYRIYRASDTYNLLRGVDFYSSNQAALIELEWLAKAERKAEQSLKLDS